MASLLTVRLTKGDSPSWGFRLQGGKDFGTPLVIQKVIVGSPAERAGLVAGDSVIRVNNTDVFNLRHKDAQDILLRSGNTFDMTIQRGGSTWKPSVIPTGTLTSRPQTINNISPVTRTSLAAKPSENIGAIGTGHNVAAKPFVNGTLNGGPKVVNNQYNSPLKLYSEESIAETLSAQTEVLSTGVLGVNFKKNEKNYDASKSAVLSLLKEEESSPRSADHTDHHQSSGIDSAPSPVAIAGLRHVAAPENKPQPPSPQLPPGQNICADCERLIVGVFVRIKDKNLHVECFKCSTCGSSLKNVGYYNINNKLYCDIHAKLAARNNPPAPNLIPVTVPPGGKPPANAISAALASHPYPTTAPLSPKINSYQAPLSGPKPFCSVPGPLSPSSNFNSLQRTEAPISPVPPITTSAYSPVSAPVHSLSSIIWPPVQEEPEFPTACPLFYPPPSQVDSKIRKRTDSKDSDNWEVEEINSMNQYHYETMDESNYSYEQRSATECVENISGTLDTQILVENIIKSRPHSPPFEKTIQEKSKSNGENVSQKQTSDEIHHESNIEMCRVKRESHTPVKVDNPVPKKWESQMLQALTISVDNPKTSLSEFAASNITSEKVCLERQMESTLSNIPTKETSTALGLALKVAPKEPFNPVKDSQLKFVSLPEETTPYFPPEDLFAIPVKHSDDKEKPFRKKKDINLEKIMEDLPKSQKKLSMLSALTTAPDRPFTPDSFKKIIDEKAETESNTNLSEITTTTVVETKTKESSRPISLPVCQELQQQDDLTPSPECLPLFKGFTCSFQNKTDHSKFDIQISTNPPTRNKTKKPKAVTSEQTHKLNEIEDTKIETKEEKVLAEKVSTYEIKKTKSTEIKETKSSEKKVENVHYKKPEQMISLRKPTSLPPYQISVKENAEADIIMMKKIEKSKYKKDEKVKSEIKNLAKIDKVDMSQQAKHDSYPQPHISESRERTCPIIKLQEVQLHSEGNSFIPVDDSIPESCSVSARPRPLTPSMINKPPPIIPYYQANLVAQKYGPPSVNLLDPKSPAISRSPSPVPELSKATHQLRSKSPNIRSQSPAQGPPCNPLQHAYVPQVKDFRIESAKDNLTAFIPQYKEKRDMMDDNRSRIAGNEFEISQHGISCTSDIIDQREMAPVQCFYGECKTEDISSASGNKKLNYKLDETSSKQTAETQRVEFQSHIDDNTELSTKISEKSHMEKSEGFRKIENESVEKSSDGSVQIQRKKTITEEMEHSQKSHEITIEKNVVDVHRQGFRNVKNIEDDTHHVVGLHVTAPNPIRSRFLKPDPTCSTPPKLNTVCQKVGKDVLPKKKEEYLDVSHEQGPIFPKFNASVLSEPKALPELTNKMVQDEKPCRRDPIKHIQAPGSSKSNQILNPSNPSSNIGTVGGRQTGAVGTAPKRGRGVLNAAQLGGRIALCAQCHGQIRGPFITALGKIWCPNHFICSTQSCRRPLQDLGFVEEHGQLYCEYCFEQYLAPICSKCGSKIKGDCLKAIGKAFHPECFNCVHCGKLFGNSPFFLEDGSPYCETDWNEFFTTKCFACGFPVEAGDRWVEALNNNYHSQCFNCTMCKKNLEGQSFFAKGGRPYCKNHAR